MQQLTRQHRSKFKHRGAGLCKYKKMEASKTIERSRKSKIECIPKKYWLMLFISEGNVFRKNKYIIICYSVRQIMIYITHLYIHHNRDHLFNRTTDNRWVNKFKLCMSITQRWNILLKKSEFSYSYFILLNVNRAVFGRISSVPPA